MTCKDNFTPKGFTLLEVLLVVGIIAIISSVVLWGVRSFQEHSRDTSRLAQAKHIMKALELYYLDHGEYPASTDGPEIYMNLSALKEELVDGGYISRIPEDPLYEYNDTADSYRYCSIPVTNDSPHYVLFVNMEGDNLEATDENTHCFIPRLETGRICTAEIGEKENCYDKF